MFNHLLIIIALISFSIASHAAVGPMDAAQAADDATQNAVLYKEVAVTQGGSSDKDVAEPLAVTSKNPCPANTICPVPPSASINIASPKINGWFALKGDANVLQPIAVLLLIIGLIVFFLSRKSTSTK